MSSSVIADIRGSQVLEGFAHIIADWKMEYEIENLGTLFYDYSINGDEVLDGASFGLDDWDASDISHCIYPQKFDNNNCVTRTSNFEAPDEPIYKFISVNETD